MLKADSTSPINHYLEVELQPSKRSSTRSARSRLLPGAGARHRRPASRVDAPAAFGSTALRVQYVRSRNLMHLDPKYRRNRQAGASVDPTPNIARIKRQQAFIRKLGRSPCTADRRPAHGSLNVDGVVPKLTADPSFDRAAFDQLVRSFLAGLEEPRTRCSSTRCPGPTGGARPGRPAGALREEARLRRRASPACGVRSPIPSPPAADAGTTPGATAAPALRPGRRAGEGAERLGRAERRRQRPEQRWRADRLRQRRGRQRLPRRDRQDRDPLASRATRRRPSSSRPKRAGRDGSWPTRPSRGHRRGPGARTRLQGHKNEAAAGPRATPRTTAPAVDPAAACE